MVRDKKILRWEIVGFVVITLIGSALHFCYEWSGGFKPLALICAVNESVWEHTKMGFWPALFYTIAEYVSFGKRKINFFVAKALAFYAIPIIIIVVYYLLQATIGKHAVWIDIALFVFTILVSQIISYKITTSRKDYSKFNLIACGLIILIIAAFSLFTYFPPKLEMFKNPHTGGYGIP